MEFSIISSITTSKDLKKYGELFFLDAFFDFSHENFQGKKYVLQVAESLIFSEIKYLYNEKNVRYLKSILQKMINSKYISLKNKKVIQQKFDIINSY